MRQETRTVWISNNGEEHSTQEGCLFAEAKQMFNQVVNSDDYLHTQAYFHTCPSHRCVGEVEDLIELLTKQPELANTIQMIIDLRRRARNAIFPTE